MRVAIVDCERASRRTGEVDAWGAAVDSAPVSPLEEAADEAADGDDSDDLLAHALTTKPASAIREARFAAAATKHDRSVKLVTPRSLTVHPPSSTPPAARSPTPRYSV
ncbi:MAG: hypothetical protein U0271_33985 [Polyangiaceae bacterium]